MSEQNLPAAVAAFDFHGAEIAAFVYKGRPVVVARHVGRVLGYFDDGARIVTSITVGWKDRLHRGKHYEVIEGQDLVDLKARLTSAPEVSSGKGVSGWLDTRTPSILVLTETGLHKVVMLTDKPIGDELLDQLAENVLPKLRRGIPVANLRGDPVAQVVVETPPEPKPFQMKAMTGRDCAALREARLCARRLDTAGMDRKAVAGWMAGVFEGITGIPTSQLLRESAPPPPRPTTPKPSGAQMNFVLVPEGQVKPATPPPDDDPPPEPVGPPPAPKDPPQQSLRTANEVAKKHDIPSGNMVGRLANYLGIKADPSMCRMLDTKHANNDGVSESARYTAAGEAAIAEEWARRQRGHAAEVAEKARQRAAKRRESRKAKRKGPALAVVPQGS